MFIASTADNDLYKFTMQNGVCNMYPREIVQYDFFIREDREFPDGFGKLLQEAVDSFRGLVLPKNVEDYIKKNCYFFSPVYVDFLKGYKYDPSEVEITQKGSKISVRVRGYWYRTILWESPLMATISNLYFEMTGQTTLTRDQRREINKTKAEALERMKALFSEFGVRRRSSFENHNEVIGDLKEFAPTALIGTSNLHLAAEHNIKVIGTQAHEWFMFHGAKFGFGMANQMGLKKWVDVYQGDLGIALTDTFTSQSFYETAFTTKFAKLFDGVRHDSGKALKFVDLTVDHYNKLRINPKLKSIVFSDGISSIKAVEEIKAYCKGKINDAYGIGTWMTNDVGLKPLNIVIKLTAVLINGVWVPTVKLSDSPTKNTGPLETISLCKEALRIDS